MTTKDDLHAYRDGWLEVNRIELQELRTTSIDIKWQQLNSIINLAIKLGIFKADPSEGAVYQKWAWLKGKSNKQRR